MGRSGNNNSRLGPRWPFSVGLALLAFSQGMGSAYGVIPLPAHYAGSVMVAMGLGGFLLPSIYGHLTPEPKPAVRFAFHMVLTLLGVALGKLILFHVS